MDGRKRLTYRMTMSTAFLGSKVSGSKSLIRFWPASGSAWLIHFKLHPTQAKELWQLYLINVRICSRDASYILINLKEFLFVVIVT